MESNCKHGVPITSCSENCAAKLMSVPNTSCCTCKRERGTVAVPCLCKCHTSCCAKCRCDGATCIRLSQEGKPCQCNYKDCECHTAHQSSQSKGTWEDEFWKFVPDDQNSRPDYHAMLAFFSKLLSEREHETEYSKECPQCEVLAGSAFAAGATTERERILAALPDERCTMCGTDMEQNDAHKGFKECLDKVRSLLTHQ